MTPLTVIWEGPFAWPGYEQENGLPTLPEYSGIYLQAFEYDGGFAIWGPGITARPFYKRFREHTRGFLKGNYTVLDPEAVQQRGERKEVWHGWGEARKRRVEFEQRQGEITEAVHRMLAAMRIFVADVGPDNRVARRMEAGVTDLLYSQGEPLSLLADRGTSLSRRWPNEDVILVDSRYKVLLHGMPPTFEI